MVFRTFEAIKNLQAEDPTDIIAGVPFPLDRQEAELLAAISDDYCGIDIRIVPYTREQYADDCARRAALAIVKAHKESSVPTGS